MKNLTLKAVQLIALIMIDTLTLNAQKLPNIQERPVALPPDVKIDGILNEWDNKLEAYNKSTDIYYTLAHDKQNLYLAVQASDPDIIKKIMRGGVTLTICTSGERNDPNPLTVIFPVLSDSYQRGFTMLHNNLIAARKNNGNIDSASNALNRLISSGEKQIKVKGFKAINDSLISIYNNFGMKAIGLIDDKAVFISELMIPLELTGPITGKEIAYHIILSGEPAVVRKATANAVTVIPMGKSAPVDQSLFYPTDFWGRYKLN